MKKEWEIKKLGDLVTQINGLWKGKKEPFINVAVIRNTNFSKDCKLKLDDVEYLDVELKQYSSRKLQAGDIIIEKSGGSDKQPVGRPILFNIEDGEYSFSNFTSTLRIKDVSQVSSEYLQQYLYFRWLNGDTRDLQSHTTGIHNLDFKAYLNFDIILPPLEEQKRIVKILDEKFAQLETIKANAQTNLQNAKDLFQSQLTKAFNNTTWEKKRLGDIITLLSGQDFPPERYNSENKGIPYITGASNFNEDGSILINRWTETPTVIAKRLDVLLVVKGSGYGKTTIADFAEAHIARQIMALRVSPDLERSFLFYYLNCKFDEIKQKGNGVIPGITRSDVLEMSLNLPLSPSKNAS